MKNDIVLSVLEDVKNQLGGLSDAFLNAAPGTPYFEDSCKVVHSRLTISRLIDALELFSKYAKD